MNKKLVLLNIALIGAISTNCLAADIKHGKILEHKEWTTGKATGSFSKNKPTNFNLRNHTDTSGFVESILTSAKGLAGNVSSFKGVSWISFTNESASKREYTMYSSICATTADHTENCLHAYEQVELEPQGSYGDFIEPELRMIFDKPGTYQISVNTQLTDFQGTYHNSHALNTIDVA